MNLKTKIAWIFLCSALIWSSIINVLQWQHHARVTNTLNAEIARLQAKANVEALNHVGIILLTNGYFYGGPATITNIPYIPYEMGTTVYNNILLTNNLRGVSKILK